MGSRFFSSLFGNAAETKKAEGNFFTPAAHQRWETVLPAPAASKSSKGSSKDAQADDFILRALTCAALSKLVYNMKDDATCQQLLEDFASNCAWFRPLRASLSSRPREGPDSCMPVYCVVDFGCFRVVAIRGTKTLADWKRNLHASPSEYRRCLSETEAIDDVHAGFARDARLIPVELLVDWNGDLSDGQSEDVLFTGHSAGGAAAEVCVLPFICNPDDGSKPCARRRVFAYTFGSPAVAYESARWVKSIGPAQRARVLRFYSTSDSVPYVGGSVGLDVAVETCIRVDYPVPDAVASLQVGENLQKFVRRRKVSLPDYDDQCKSMADRSGKKPYPRSVLKSNAHNKSASSSTSATVSRSISSAAAPGAFEALNFLYDYAKEAVAAHSVDGYLSYLLQLSELTARTHPEAPHSVSPLVPEMSSVRIDRVAMASIAEEANVMLTVTGIGLFASPVTALLQCHGLEGSSGQLRTVPASTCNVSTTLVAVPQQQLYFPVDVTDGLLGTEMQRVCNFQLEFDVTGLAIEMGSSIVIDPEEAIALKKSPMLAFSNGFQEYCCPVEPQTKRNIAFLGCTGSGKSQLIESYKAYLLENQTAAAVDDGAFIANDEYARSFCHNGVRYYETSGFAESSTEWARKTNHTMEKYPPQVLVIVTRLDSKFTPQGLPAVVARFRSSSSRPGADDALPVVLVITKVRKLSSSEEDQLAAAERNARVADMRRSLGLAEGTLTLFVNSVYDKETMWAVHGIAELHSALQKLQLRLDEKHSMGLNMSIYETICCFYERNRRSIKRAAKKSAAVAAGAAVVPGLVMAGASVEVAAAIGTTAVGACATAVAAAYAAK